MSAKFRRPLKVIAFNANGIWKQRYQLSKQLQDLHIDAALLSETHLKRHEGFFIPNYHLYRPGRFPGGKGGTAVALRKGFPHNHGDLSPLILTSIATTSLRNASCCVLVLYMSFVFLSSRTIYISNNTPTFHCA
jgi:hypothetical protein